MSIFVQMLDNPVSHRLGWCLLHSVWEGALGAALFAIIRVGLRRRSPNARYTAACAVLGLLLAAPVVTFFCISPGPVTLPQTGAGAFGAFFQSVEHDIADKGQSSWGETATLPLPYVHSIVEKLDQDLPWMVGVWVIGVVAFTCRWFHGSYWVGRVKTVETEAFDCVWLSRMRTLCHRLGVNRPVQLLKSKIIDVPMVVGWLRPVILVPASALAGLTPDELEAIITHELAHVRRYDYLVNLFQHCVETLMFYHPAVWWVSGCIREERESCCDDLVVRVCGDRVAYARALMTLEETRRCSPLAFAANGGSLLLRVRRLLGVADSNRPPGAAEIGGIALVAIGGLFILSALWLLNCPGMYQAAALVRVNPGAATQNPANDSRALSGLYYPYFLQTECLVMRSSAVLNGVIELLQRNDQDQKRRPGQERRSRNEGLGLLRKCLNLRPVPSTSVIEIQATGSQAAEAARIANAVATTYKQYRMEQRRLSVNEGMDALEVSLNELRERVLHAERDVDRLGAELKIPEPSMPGAEPAMLLSGEALRHLEALRIEAEAECVKSRTLLEHLEALDPDKLSQAIPSVGIEDSQLLENMDSLSLVEQKLISLQKDLGPEHIEVTKALAQEVALKRRLRERTAGIMNGLRAKVAASGQSIASLSNAVANALHDNAAQAAKTRQYLDAKRNLEDLQRFQSVLQIKLGEERANGRPQDLVEILEEAVAPAQSATPNRPLAISLFAAGLLLAFAGGLMIRAGRSTTGTGSASSPECLKA